jgi:hypothetical protein
MPLIVGVIAAEDESNPSGNKMKQWFAIRLQYIKAWIAWFFKGAENTVITGTVTARSNNVLIVTDASGNRFNIVLPGRWNVDQQIVSLNDIDQYLNGQVTVKALSRMATNDNGVTVTYLIANEIAANGKTLYAVVTYNIKG